MLQARTAVSTAQANQSHVPSLHHIPYAYQVLAGVRISDLEMVGSMGWRLLLGICRSLIQRSFVSYKGSSSNSKKEKKKKKKKIKKKRQLCNLR